MSRTTKKKPSRRANGFMGCCREKKQKKEEGEKLCGILGF